MKSNLASLSLNWLECTFYVLTPTVEDINTFNAQRSLFTFFTSQYNHQKICPDCSGRLYNDFMLRYRIPGKVLPDRAKEFKNNLFSLLSKLCGIKRLQTTYHPKTNGQTERMINTLISMLKNTTRLTKNAVGKPY